MANRVPLCGPASDRPASWSRAPVGYRLADGGAVVAILIPVRPAPWNGGARWIADRIDAEPGGKPFRDLASAIEWAEGAEWYGPVRDRIARPRGLA